MIINIIIKTFLIVLLSNKFLNVINYKTLYKTFL